MAENSVGGMNSSMSKSIWVSITSIKNSSFSISLWFSFSITLSIKAMGIWVTGISQRTSSTWDCDISGVHTWCRLSTESIGAMGIRMAEAISVTSIQECWVSLSFSTDSSNKGKRNNKELIHFEMIQL